MVMLTDKSNPETPEDVIKQGLSQGMSKALEDFINVRRIDVTPGVGSPSPIAAFTVAVTSEFGGNKEIYPLKESLFEQVHMAIDQIIPIVKQLLENDEKDNAIKLARTVMYKEVLLFLDRHVVEIIKIIKAIRDTEIKT